MKYLKKYNESVIDEHGIEEHFDREFDWTDIKNAFLDLLEEKGASVEFLYLERNIL